MPKLHVARAVVVVLALAACAATWNTGHPRWALSAAQPKQVQAHPLVHLVVWGRSRFAIAPRITKMLGPDAAAYWETLAQYGVHAPRLVGPTISFARPPTSLTQILSWVHHQAGTHPNHDVQYLVMANGPAWAKGTMPGMVGMWGRHLWDSGVAVDVVVADAVMAAAHEIAEAATDPIAGAGWIGPGGQEVADRCETTVGGLIGAGRAVLVVPVPALWSQRLGRCVG